MKYPYYNTTTNKIVIHFQNVKIKTEKDIHLQTDKSKPLSRALIVIFLIKNTSSDISNCQTVNTIDYNKTTERHIQKLKISILTDF